MHQTENNGLQDCMPNIFLHLNLFSLIMNIPLVLFSSSGKYIVRKKLEIIYYRNIMKLDQ